QDRAGSAECGQASRRRCLRDAAVQPRRERAHRARGCTRPLEADDVSLTPDEARALHAEVHVLDLHADTAKLMDKLGYDLAARHERPMPTGVNVFGHVDLPRMRDG